jgi:hypothetical protein
MAACRFANYTLGEAPSINMSAAVAAAAAAALAQQQAAVQQQQQQLASPTMAPAPALGGAQQPMQRQQGFFSASQL